MSDEIRAEIERLKEKLIYLRREFHREPELGFKEKKTGRKIYKYLKRVFSGEKGPYFFSPTGLLFHSKRQT